MSRHRRGRITVQHQPTGAERGMMKMMGVVHAVFGGVFALVALTAIMPNAGLIGLPFLVGGLFFCINGIRLVVSKNDIPHRVGYDVETGIEEETILGLMDEVPTKSFHNSDQTVENSTSSPALDPNAKQRLEQLEGLKTAGLITDREYQAKRQEILRNL